MNNKLLKASLAGAAALAVGAGGSTFAAWSDFSTQGAGAGAGYLRLAVNGHDGTDTSQVQPFNLAPGVHKTQTFWFTSTDAHNVTHGALTAYVANLTNIEDGTSGTCTTASEAAEEGTSNCVDNGGELSHQADLYVGRALNIASAAACDHYDATAGNILVDHHVMDNAPTAASPITVDDDMAPGDGVCMVVEVTLPNLPGTVNNAVQGDDMSWTWHFDLTQI